jgi:dipeptidyl aminopeptidase/acylaminoacyl peptidase
MSRHIRYRILIAALTVTALTALACGDSDPAAPGPVVPDPTVPSTPPGRVVASLELDAASVSLEEGATRTFVATPRDARGAAITGLSIAWSSSDTAIARVDLLGKVTAMRAGAATLTATVNGMSAQAVVAVAASYGFDLLYEQRTFDVFRELFRLDIRAAGAAPARMFPAQQWASQARPSPDGSRIAYVCPNPIIGDPAICVAGRDGGGAAMIAAFIGESFDAPTWSPDGGRLAFVRTKNEDGVDRSHIWLVNADGTGLAAITAELPGSQAMPAWSPRLPDGSERIAWVQDVNLSPRIWTMRPDGSDRRRLGSAGDVRDIQPAWSPDGLTIAFQRTSATVPADLWLMRVDGSDERALMPMVALSGAQLWPAWSPDGRIIAFTSSHERVGTSAPSYQVYTVWSDGSRLSRRTLDAGDKAAPSWLPRPE